MVVDVWWTLRKAPAAPPEFRIPRVRLMMMLLPAPASPFLSSILYYPIVDESGWKESIPGKIWGKSARDLAFPCGGIFLVITRTSSPFPSLFLRFPSYLLESFHVLALCVVCVYIYVNSTTPTPFITFKKQAKEASSSFMPRPSTHTSCFFQL